MKIENRDKNLLIIVFLIFAVEAMLFFDGNIDFNKKIALKEKIKEEQKIKLEKLRIDLNNLTEKEVLAKAVSVYDITDKNKIYGKNDNIVLPMASLVKTMTVLVVLDNHSKDQNIYITKDYAGKGLNEGEKWNIADLARFTMILSSNLGASALSSVENDFVGKMNVKAKEIGLLNTNFINPTGLDENIYTNEAGGYTSAFDANILAGYAYNAYPEVFDITALQKANLESLSGVVHEVYNTNYIADKIPNLLFSKTGYTDLAGGNLTVIFENKEEHKIAVTLLGSTKEGRFTDMEKIINVLQ